MWSVRCGFVLLSSPHDTWIEANICWLLICLMMLLENSGEVQRQNPRKKLGRCRHVVLKSLCDLFEFTLAWYVNLAILAWCGISNKASFSIMTARLWWLFQQKWFNKIWFHMICQHCHNFNCFYSYYWVSLFHFFWMLPVNFAFLDILQCFWIF